jgi:hypothetical protein
MRTARRSAAPLHLRLCEDSMETLLGLHQGPITDLYRCSAILCSFSCSFHTLFSNSHSVLFLSCAPSPPNNVIGRGLYTAWASWRTNAEGLFAKIVTPTPTHAATHPPTHTEITATEHASSCSSTLPAPAPAIPGSSSAPTTLSQASCFVGTFAKPYLHHTSAYDSIRQHTSAYVSIPGSASASSNPCASLPAAYVSILQHTSAYVSIRQHT